LNIVLIGYRCSGKTVVGKILAHELGRNFLDMDTTIEERTGRSIETIISQEGWDPFRLMEKGLIEEVSREDNMIIATGGGVVTDEDNVKNLRRNGWVVWLNSDPEVLKERMNGDQRSGKIRPPLAGSDSLEEIDRVLQERIGLYDQASHLVVDTTDRSPREVAGAIIAALPGRLKTTT
jgi:shikimate kinase